MLIFSNNYLTGNGTNLMQRPFIAGMLKNTIVKCMLPKPETFYSTDSQKDNGDVGEKNCYSIEIQMQFSFS